jgi:hypothetical protein
VGHRHEDADADAGRHGALFLRGDDHDRERRKPRARRTQNAPPELKPSELCLEGLKTKALRQGNWRPRHGGQWDQGIDPPDDGKDPVAGAVSQNTGLNHG